MTISERKHCANCGETKDRSEFHRRSESIDGLQAYCKVCNIANADDTNPSRMFVNGKYIPKDNPLHKPGRYKALDDAWSHETLESVADGFVYVMTNPAFPGWCKVGMAVSADDRINSFQTGDPFRAYKLVGAVYCQDRAAVEAAAHDHCERSGGERRGEWFYMQENHAFNIVRQEANRHAAELDFHNGC